MIYHINADREFDASEVPLHDTKKLPREAVFWCEPILFFRELHKFRYIWHSS